MRILQRKGFVMRHIYDRTVPRRPVNLSLNSDLIAKARSENLNLSAIAEDAISHVLTQIATTRFHEDIARGVVEYEGYLQEYGSFTDAVQAMADKEGEERA
jgi:antitoxin CcdA